MSVTPAERNGLRQPSCAVTLANHICMLKRQLGHGETKDSTEEGNWNNFPLTLICKEDQEDSWSSIEQSFNLRMHETRGKSVSRCTLGGCCVPVRVPVAPEIGFDMHVRCFCQ